MATINLIRIDSRLIHGQVITKWLKIAKANRVIIVDDELAADEFMSVIYATAAPKDVKVDIFSAEKAHQSWKEDELGKGSLLILFKDVKTCYRMFKLGFPLNRVQIGGLSSAPGRTVILRAVSIDQTDMEQLKEIHEANTEVYIHIIPEEPKLDFDGIISKFKKK